MAAQEQRIALRLPTWLLRAIDDEAARWRRDRPASSVNRSDLIRELLAKALATWGSVQIAREP